MNEETICRKRGYHRIDTRTQKLTWPAKYACFDCREYVYCHEIDGKEIELENSSGDIVWPIRTDESRKSKS